MTGRLAHEVTDDGVLVVLRPSIGAPSHLRVDSAEAIRFARTVLEDLGAGDGLGAGGRRITVGRITVDTGSKTAAVDGREIHLTAKEYLILEALALRCGHTFTKEQLFDHLYQGADQPEIKIVDVFICKVRHKLEPSGADQQLETIWGRGYRLVEAPTEAGWVRSDLQVNSGVQAAIVARLAVSEGTFADLWSAIPHAAQNSVRNAIGTLLKRGVIATDGEPRRATYRLMRREAAA